MNFEHKIVFMFYKRHMIIYLYTKFYKFKLITIFQFKYFKFIKFHKRCFNFVLTLNYLKIPNIIHLIEYICDR